jgi:metal-sulfur cluster biosynthetic enzyme
VQPIEIDGGERAGVLTESEVCEALRGVEDPEAGMSIVDLGLVYEVDVTPTRIHVRMTMTSPACPVASYIVEESVAAIRSAAPGVPDVDVELVWEPPWTPDRMSGAARERFGWSGGSA